MLHVLDMDHLRNNIPSMIASARRDWGRGMGRRVYGSEPSQMNEPKPRPEQNQLEQKNEVEVENADDDEKM